MDYAGRARALYTQGYSCEQAVIGAFCGAEGGDLAAAAELARLFGGPAARDCGLCGAAGGMCVAAGMVYCGRAAAEDILCVAYRLSESFRRRSGSLSCCRLREGAGLDGCAPGGENGSFCANLVERAAGLLAAQMERDGL